MDNRIIDFDNIVMTHNCMEDWLTPFSIESVKCARIFLSYFPARYNPRICGSGLGNVIFIVNDNSTRVLIEFYGDTIHIERVQTDAKKYICFDGIKYFSGLPAIVMYLLNCE
jgi:hypothetical protein